MTWVQWQETVVFCLFAFHEVSFKIEGEMKVTRLAAEISFDDRGDTGEASPWFSTLHFEP